MPRAPFQVLILPFRRTASGAFEFAALRRRDDGRWQGVAGGGEDDESPAQTARRELCEELRVDRDVPLFALETLGQVPAHVFEARTDWPDSLEFLPEHTFAVDCTGQVLHLSDEHTAIEWGDAASTAERLSWRTNRDALEELTRLLACEGPARTSRHLGAANADLARPAQRQARRGGEKCGPDDQRATS